MNIAGATVRVQDVRLLATMLDGELAAKLERAVAQGNSIVAVDIADRERIVAVLRHEPPFGLSELRSALVTQLEKRRRQDARAQQIRDHARLRAPTTRA